MNAVTDREWMNHKEAVEFVRKNKPRVLWGHLLIPHHQSHDSVLWIRVDFNASYSHELPSSFMCLDGCSPRYEQYYSAGNFAHWSGWEMRFYTNFMMFRKYWLTRDKTHE